MEKKQISAKIIADSIDSRGNRITSYILTYPRFIHAELMTHRMFSRNSASSRAIPFEKMVKMVEEDPFIPIAWQKDHKGMQGTEYFNHPDDIKTLQQMWKIASLSAIDQAVQLHDKPIAELEDNLSKQLCNRLLEPFMWHTVLVTATEYYNFFELRCPNYYEGAQFAGGPYFFKSKKDYSKVFSKGKHFSLYDWEEINSSQAEIHIQALSEAMWDAMNESIPNKLEADQWHIPFGDKISLINWLNIFNDDGHLDGDLDEQDRLFALDSLKISTARCARLSYMTFDGEIDYVKDIKLHNQLLASKHMSPFEHCAVTMSEEEYYSFIKGKVPTQIDKYGITNLEMMPYSTGIPPIGFSGLNLNNGDKYGWCNNFRGFIPYRYLIENNG